MSKKRAGQKRDSHVPVARDRTDGRRAEEILRPIVDGITPQVGEQFLRALVRHLAAALKVRFAFISEQLDHEGGRLRLVAFWEGDDYGENFEYPTKGTPCEHVIGKELASFPSGLRERFPEDAWLRKVGAESYLAIPLFDSAEDPLGHLGVMHDEPMDGERLNEQILRIFAERAGGELERKRAEEALRHSEERYRELVENINDVIYEVDTSGRITYISPVAEEVSGYSPNEIIGRSIVEFMPPQEVPARMDSFREGLSGRPVPTEFSLVSKSGEIRWIHTLGRVIREGDRITGFRGVLTDITERKRAEEALRESEERYRELVENINDVIYEVDSSGRVAYISPAVEEISGYAPAEVIGRPFSQFIHPDDVSLTVEGFQRVLSGRPEPLDARILSKSGEVVWIQSSSRPIFQGDRVIGTRGVLTDITARKHAEEALRESEERLKILFESAPDAYYLNDLEGRFVDGNRAAEEISGYKREELIGQSFLSLKLLSPDEISRSAVVLARNAQGEATGPDEFTLNRKDGSQVAVEIRTFVVRIRGEVLVLGSARDISKRKRAEEAMREREETLRALLNATTESAFLLERDGTVITLNQTAAERLGGSVDDLIGSSPSDRMPPAVAAFRRAKGDEVSHSGKPCRFEDERDGRRYDTTIYPVFGPDGEVERLAVFANDITERKRMEEALREREERYRALYEDNPSMYFTVDTEGTVLSVNRFGAEQLGYTADELVGQSVLTISHGNDKKAVLKQLAACVRNPAELVQREFRKVRKDGSLMWARESARAVRGPDGDTTVLIVCEDITEQKRAEEALQEAREELESRVETQMQRGNSYGLTFRELTVIHLVAAGTSDKEIGALLGISPRTANKHLQNILIKMGASSRTEVGVRAVREGLVA